CVPIKKGGVLIFSPSGGAASIFADKAADQGILLPELSEETKIELRKILPPYTAPANPFDIGGGVFTDPSIAERCQDVVCRDKNIDILTWTLVGPPRNPLTAKMIEGFINVSRKYNKPTAVHTLAGYLNEEGFKVFAQSNSPTFDSIEGCLKAIKSYIDYQNFIKRKPSNVPLQSSLPPVSEHFGEVKVFLTSLKGSITEYQSKKLLSYYGIATPKGGMAQTENEALKIAKSIGYPVVLKVSSPHILHKTEAKVIATSIRNESELKEDYKKVMNNARAYNPMANIEGVLVEEMAGDGIEVIIGSIQDPQFGPSVMFGPGGVLVEIMKDVAMRVPPFGVDDAREMVEEIKGAQILKGYRGKAEADIDAIVDTLLKVSTLSIELRDLVSELDINPLMVYDKGRGVMALDALIRLK
ncbi:MAG: acetate--CoA ligase family protein, partial [Candidatus Helarchaeota archaeon]|nr:acetate--CoA ligase family protein [Candidatus Helarchaeota archaeon]